jgi:hypothetical protein
MGILKHIMGYSTPLLAVLLDRNKGKLSIEQWREDAARILGASVAHRPTCASY